MAIEDNDSMTTGPGPGEKPVGVGGVVSLAAYCIFGFLLCGSALVELWPHPTPAGTATTSDTTGTGKTETPPPAGHTGAESSGTVTTTPPATTSSPSSSAVGRDSSATAATTPGTIAAPAAPAATTTTNTAGNAPTPQAPESVCRDAKSGCVQCEKEAAARRGLSSSDAKTYDPECVHLWWMWLVLWQEERLLLIVLLAGALGSLLYTVGSFTKYAGIRKLVLSWVPWYILTPFVGAFLAAVFYLTIRGGFFSSNASVSSTSPFGFAGLAALVGMFSRQATEKLRKIFDALFTTAPAGPEGVGTPAKPVLLAVTGTITHGQAAHVTLTGSGFAKTSTAHIGAQELPTVWKSDTALEADLAANLVPAAGQTLTFTVVTPPPGGGTSDGKGVVVQ
jgi:hypothetical protein